MKVQLIIILIILTRISALSQTTFEAGLLPSLNVNKKLPRDWSTNLKTESRQRMYQDELSYDYLLTDVALMAAKKIGINSSFGLGYLIRFEDQSLKQRSIQQLNIVSRFLGFRLAHRFSADQTFSDGEPVEYRFRYRISFEIPLQGLSVDPGEFYLKLSNEGLNSFQDSDYDLEIRINAFPGYKISPRNKVEFGIDNRLDSFLSGTSRNRMWLGINYYLSI